MHVFAELSVCPGLTSPSPHPLPGRLRQRSAFFEEHRKARPNRTVGWKDAVGTGSARPVNWTR